MCSAPPSITFSQPPLPSGLKPLLHVAQLQPSVLILAHPVAGTEHCMARSRSSGTSAAASNWEDADWGSGVGHAPHVASCCTAPPSECKAYKKKERKKERIIRLTRSLTLQAPRVGAPKNWSQAVQRQSTLEYVLQLAMTGHCEAVRLVQA